MHPLEAEGNLKLDNNKAEKDMVKHRVHQSHHDDIVRPISC